jgi:branched-chain amino acid transport system permease protein
MKLLREHPNALLCFGLAAIGVAAVQGKPVWMDSTVIIGIQALIALSVGLSYGQAGILSMAQAVLASVGGYVSAVLALKYGISPYIGLLAAVALPTAMAWVLARFVTPLDHLAAALATLALSTVIEIAARNWDSVTGGYVGLTGIPPLKGFGSPGAFCALVWACVCLVVFGYENLMRSPFGRALNTVRHDRARAMADGVDAPRLMSAAFALSAGIAGLAGWLYVHYIGFMGPGALDTGASISVLLMAVIGGVGYVLGPVIGTVLLTLVLHQLPAQEVQGLFYGVTLIVILLFARDGLMGYADRTWKSWRMRGRGTREAASEGAGAGAIAGARVKSIGTPP